MIIFLKDLDRGKPLELEQKLDTDSLRHHDILSFNDSTFRGEARRESGLAVVEGRIEGSLKARCSKCLEPVEYPFSIPFEESFSDKPVDEDSDIHEVEDGRIELDPYLLEALFLDLPQVFVCGDDCLGLCPSCGINRNVESCTCRNERIDPRLADLALFFSKNNE